MMGIRHPNATCRSREDRRKEAERLAAERAKLGPDQQLEVLDARLGRDQGAKKERKRMTEQLLNQEQ